MGTINKGIMSAEKIYLDSIDEIKENRSYDCVFEKIETNKTTFFSLSLFVKVLLANNLNINNQYELFFQSLKKYLEKTKFLKILDLSSCNLGDELLVNANNSIEKIILKNFTLKRAFYVPNLKNFSKLQEIQKIIDQPLSIHGKFYNNGVNFLIDNCNANLKKITIDNEYSEPYSVNSMHCKDLFIQFIRNNIYLEELIFTHPHNVSEEVLNIVQQAILYNKNFRKQAELLHKFVIVLNTEYKDLTLQNKAFICNLFIPNLDEKLFSTECKITDIYYSSFLRKIEFYLKTGELFVNKDPLSLLNFGTQKEKHSDKEVKLIIDKVCKKFEQIVKTSFYGSFVLVACQSNINLAQSIRLLQKWRDNSNYQISSFSRSISSETIESVFLNNPKIYIDESFLETNRKNLSRISTQMNECLNILVKVLIKSGIIDNDFKVMMPWFMENKLSNTFQLYSQENKISPELLAHQLYCAVNMEKPFKELLCKNGKRYTKEHYVQTSFAIGFEKYRLGTSFNTTLLEEDFQAIKTSVENICMKYYYNCRNLPRPSSQIKHSTSKSLSAEKDCIMM